MKLVYVTSGFPYPLTSGYLRHFHLLERLAHHHEIRLFSLVGADHVPEDRLPVERLGVDVSTFAVHSTSWRRRSAKIARLVPGFVAGGPAELRRAVGECVASGWPDAVVLTGKSTNGVLRTVDGLPLVVDACDATSMRLEIQLDDRHGVERILGSLELWATRTIERRMQRRADHVLVASVRDGRHLGWSDHMTVVPNGVDTAYWSRSSPARPGDAVIFTGKMSYAPNADAALRLIEQVWPVVRRRRPQAELLIVGTSPGSRLVAAGESPGVTVTGRVDDMREYLERATVFAAPIRYGAGIQNKLLEALAMELPVVASSNATDGLIIDDTTVPVRATDDLATMADLIVEALESADADPSPHHAHRDWVADRFDWDVSARRLDDILGDLVAGPPSERNP